jgi:hypothetical protein
MKYLCYFTWEADTQKQSEGIRRFKETGGQPPLGTKLLGRWIHADFSGGVVLLESNDPKALTEFGLMWSDVMALKLIPVVEDEDLIEVLTRAGK